jgi:uncharacterized protein (DUF433 family)
LDLLAAGKAIDDIIAEDYFPQLSADDLRACIAYASQAMGKTH